MVLEDDIKFRDGFDELAEMALNELPDDWDALWFGGMVHKIVKFSDLLHRLEVGTGGYGVLIRETMYEKILELMRHERQEADICYMALQRDFNCFHTVRNLILHKPGMSTIQKRHVDYPELYR